MHRIDTAAAVASRPAAGPAGPNPDGYFASGDPRTGAPATMPNADWLNMIQEELACVVEQSGGALTKGTDTQLYTAILALRAAQTLGGLNDVTVKSAAAGHGIVWNGSAWVSQNLASDAEGLKKQLMMNDLMDAIAGGGAIEAIEGLADPLADMNNIDAGSSSGYVYHAAGRYLHNPTEQQVAQEAGSPVGNMLALAAGFNGTTNQNTASSAYRNNMGGGAIGKKWASPKTITKFIVYAPNDEGFSSGNATIKLRGSDNGSSWTVLYDSGPFASTAGQILTVDSGITVSSAYPYHDIEVISSIGSGDAQVAEAAFFEAAAAGDITVITDALEAFAEPGAGGMLALVEPVDAVTYGADVLIDMSKDNGSTWEALTLAKIGALSIDVDGTPTPVDAVWGEIDPFSVTGERTIRSRFRGINAKHIKLHGYRPWLEV